MTAASATVHFSIPKAHKAQAYLSTKIIPEDRLPSSIRFVAGVDVAYAGDTAIGAAVVLDYESLELLEQQTATCSVKLPYIPTLLSFREIPATMACIRRLKLQPDVFLADGHGVAHPYRCGFASHLGLALSKPTIGVAKNRLIGDPVNAYMVDKNQIVGAVVSTKNNAKPVYVSIGHLVSLQTAIEIVEHCVRNSRIPEPLLQAHRIAASGKQAFLKRAKLQKI